MRDGRDRVEFQMRAWNLGTSLALPSEIVRRALLLAAADKRSMVVVEFVGNAPKRRCRRTVWRGKGARTGHEFHFADQAAAPRLVDAVAEIVGHLLELFLPGFGVGRDVEAAILASQWASVACQSLAHDLRPGAREPSEGSLGAIQSSCNASQNVGGLIHRVYLRFATRLARRGTASARHEGSSARSTRFDSRAYGLTRSTRMSRNSITAIE